MEVFVTPRAEKHFDTIVNYLQDQWGDKTDKIYSLLQSYHLIGKIEKDDIRGFQLSRQTKILYRVKGEKVIVLAFFDVRHYPVIKYHN